MELLLER